MKSERLAALGVRFHEEIDDIRRAFDIPIILVTHNFEDVVRLATDLLILDK